MDLLTIATGPVRNIMNLMDTKNNIVGIIQFDIYMEQVKNVTLDLKLSVLSNEKIEGLEEFFVEVVPMLRTDKKRTSAHPVFKAVYEKSGEKGHFMVKNIPYEDATYRGLLLGILDITIRTKKEKIIYSSFKQFKDNN